MSHFSRLCSIFLSISIVLVQGCIYLDSKYPSVSTTPHGFDSSTQSASLPTRVQRKETPDSEVLEKPTLEIKELPILHSGSITLEANHIDFTKSVFDFDANKTETVESKKNDIVFTMTDTQPPILVLGPSFGAAGSFLVDKKISPDNNDDFFYFKDCTSSVTYGKGGIPIPSLNSSYCWRTNKGRTVEFIVSKIKKRDEASYIVEIRYIVWDK